ncbi:MAG TPA: phosphodiester glycosidase family protein [bacterium]|nr:phosphodiester glycosidase family protein [bacterium]
MQVAPGILYSHYALRTSAGPLSIHHLRLDLSNPSVRLSTSLSDDQLISDNERVSSMARRYRAVGGVNADYFDIGDSGMPLNIMVKDNELLRSPSQRVALAIGKDRSVRIVRYQWEGAIVLPETRQSYWIAGFNTGIIPDSLTVLSNARGYGAPDPGRARQTVVELVPGKVSPDSLPPMQLSALASGMGQTAYTVRQVWSQQAFYAPFPNNEILLVGRGRAAEWLLGNIKAGMAIDVQLNTVPSWQDMATVVGGGPLLVQNGQLVDDPLNPVARERDQRHPVCAVGISADGRTMLLVAVDGRQPRLSIGLTQPQLAAYMRWLGASQAMEFDSGGSVTMAVRFPGHRAPAVVNSPSDGHERPVANALLIFSMPVANRPGG